MDADAIEILDAVDSNSPGGRAPGQRNDRSTHALASGGPSASIRSTSSTQVPSAFSAVGLRAETAGDRWVATE